MTLLRPRCFLVLSLCFGLLALFPVQAQTAGDGTFEDTFPLLIGTEEGLYGLGMGGNLRLLWHGGEVRKIVAAGDSWVLLSGEGIFWSSDLLHWEERNRGLPVKTVKVFDGGQKSFVPVVQEIKDLEVCPGNPAIMVCATKDTVFLSRDSGLSWASLGMPSYRTNGIKAVAAAFLPDLTVFLSHSTYGIHYLRPDVRGAAWTELNAGIETLETTGNADEVADIMVAQGAGDAQARIYVSQTFRRRIYSLDWNQKRFRLLWSGTAEGFGTIDSLGPMNSPYAGSSPAAVTGLRFVGEDMIGELDLDSAQGSPQGTVWRNREDILDIIKNIPVYLELDPLCMVIRPPGPEDSSLPLPEGPINLSELWLLFNGQAKRPEAAYARDKEGLYLPVNHAMESRTLKPYLDLIAGRDLNMVVIDMKDDYGRLRFNPQDPQIAALGQVFRPLDIDPFLAQMKELGIYTAARIVVFKDPVLAGRSGGKYAVWDSQTGKAWAGYYDKRRSKTTPEAQAEEKKGPAEIEILPAAGASADAASADYEILRTYYDERWVDPYAEEVWDYIAGIAAELHRRGFDEIQFDYIRFPTDGDNLGNARYRWRDPGMDMESAIVSFLRHIRSRLDAPISIDIYGANGWYRTGARTGQEVELLSRYVDVICPMYYPSHFEQEFLAQAPAELRPYRIYYQGALRTSRIGRGRIVVRPYVQAFYLNVSYDRRYYDGDYVRLEVEGTRDAGRGGLTYWNNSGRYDDIPLPSALGSRRETARAGPAM
ncbi:MAG: hypothetical protein LBI94_01695 [Treponema sp.]|jgi:hypothetical protein|nr:hypothetical protein [Treponema sp.]